ncbi:RidA family protein [Paenarthrobacter sp. NPDC090520]|uniref:RidA family protein n=1 Tax=Paenarthrobacter sp. NPDC090520 TaxID=3364382 RepID=UPI0038006533
MTVQTLFTPHASQASGPYSHGRRGGDIIFTSGQIALHPETNELLTGVRESTRLVLDNLLAIVEAGGGSKETVAKVDIFVRSLDDYDEINKEYAAFFGDVRPARVLVQAVLAPGAVLEASMVAFAKD